MLEITINEKNMIAIADIPIMAYRLKLNLGTEIIFESGKVNAAAAKKAIEAFGYKVVK